MDNALILGSRMKDKLSATYELVIENIGSDSDVKKRGTKLKTEVYKVGNIGHLCILDMNAMLGLMKMETVVFCPVNRDIPLINLDSVQLMRKDTLIVELYDTQITPYPQDLLNEFELLKKSDSDLADYVSEGKRWYDDILYPCSYHKTGTTVNRRFAVTADKYIEAYIDQLNSAVVCDYNEKKTKIQDFASKLLGNGGPAVNEIRKLFGDDFARRLVLQYMYGA